MNWKDILDEVIGKLQPEYVPVEYIIMAKLIDQNGVEKVLKGLELAEFMDNPERANVREARVILDVAKIRKAMLRDVTEFFDKLSAASPDH